MSGHPDDDYDGRDYDDREEQPSNQRAIRAAKSAVTIPAIGLILTGAIGLILIAYNLIQFPNIDKQIDGEIKKIENNPQFTADQKKQQIEMMNQIRDLVKVGGIPLYVGVQYMVCGE